ncbi:hypothetical protein SDJN02_24337, partial [Cucurbita argyrosperma subsp. argyrosperma]
MRNLRVLLCSKLGVLTDDDLLFPNLEDLDISYPMNPLAPSCYMILRIRDFRFDSGPAATSQGKSLRKSLVTDKSLIDLSTKHVCQGPAPNPNLSSLSANLIGDSLSKFRCLSIRFLSMEKI